jgi:hypothetical protein
MAFGEVSQPSLKWSVKMLMSMETILNEIKTPSWAKTPARCVATAKLVKRGGKGDERDLAAARRPCDDISKYGRETRRPLPE